MDGGGLLGGTFWVRGTSGVAGWLYPLRWKRKVTMGLQQSITGGSDQTAHANTNKTQYIIPLMMLRQHQASKRPSHNMTPRGSLHMHAAQDLIQRIHGVKIELFILQQSTARARRS